MRVLKNLSKKLNMPVALLLGLLTLSSLFLFIVLARIKVRGAPVELRESLNKWAAVYGYGSYIVELLLGMSALESGRWTSKVFIYQYNPWGMKKVQTRPTTQNTSLNQAAVHSPFGWYTSFDNAAKDIFLYLNYVKAPDFWTLGGFVRFLKSKNYFDSWMSAGEYEKRIRGAIS